MPDERLIYADDFLDLFYVASAGQDKAFISTVEMVMKDTPTIDAVEVVRCKDCVHGLPSRFCIHEPAIMICTHPKLFPTRTNEDFFCSFGERKIDVEVE